MQLQRHEDAFKSLRIEKNGPVAEVVMLGPGKGNAMGPDFWREMPVAFSRMDQDPEVRVVILRGDGKAFSYGLDLPAMMGELGPLMGNSEPVVERTQLLELILRMQDAFNAIANCRKPVIAAVHGWCIGGALDAIAACDVRLCSGDAKFCLKEVKLAIVADMGSLQRLPSIIGEGNTRELAMTGREFDAPRALMMGLVTRIYTDVEKLLEGARAVAAEIAVNPPLVVQGVKQVMNERVRDEQARALRYVATWNAAFLASRDLGEAVSAFAERRPPVFQGK